MRNAIIGRWLTIGSSIALAAATILGSGSGCAADGSYSVGDPDRTSSQGFTIDEREMAATLLWGSMTVDIPVERSTAGQSLVGLAAVTLMDASGRVLDREEAHFAFGPADTVAVASVQRLHGVPDGTAPGDLAAYTVRYRVTAGGAVLSGSRSVFQMARRIATVVLGSDDLYAEEQGYLRISARNPGNDRPLGDVGVEVMIEVPNPDGGEPDRTNLWSGRTDAAGLASVEFRVPPIAGAADLVVRLHDGERTAESRHSVAVQRSHRIMLTTDKPLYQPGQTIHLRALAFKIPSGSPSAGSNLLFEVSDAKGNKVYKKETTTSAYGIAAAEFTLARQVNMGRYTIRATVDSAVQERTITVERYALPKFNIGFEADKSFYLPGERLYGRIDAGYFFGQPVAGGTVTVRASQYDVDWHQFREIVGTTDAEGHFDFTIQLPSYFVGLPLDQGGSFVKLNITVVDTAGQTFEIERAITVAYGAVSVVLIPERAVLAPGVENEIFLLTADPTGTPVSTRCTVYVGSGAAVPLVTDDRGFASFSVIPTAGTTVEIRVEADDGRGDRVTSRFSLSTDGLATETVLLRTDRTLYKVGDTAELTIYSPRPQDRLYLDAVRQGQTLLTKIISVQGGWATEHLDIDENLSGSVTLSVYYIADSGDIIRDQRVIYVEGAAGLSLAMDLDRPIYAPAETATLNIRVTDAAGEPVQAAVGLQVVDEAVFALSEFKPGLERIFFQLEDEIAESRYEIHGFTSGCVFGGGEPDVADERAQEAAKVLFAATGGRPLYGIDYSSERNIAAVVAGHVVAAVRDDAEAIALALGSYQAARSDYSEATARRWIERMSDRWFDPWGQKYTATYASWQVTLKSAGCDEQWGSEDDATVSAWVAGVEDRRGWNELDDDGAFDTAEGGPAGGVADAGGGHDASTAGEAPEFRIRQWFPETLYVNPQVITGTDGRATVEIPLADSITTWRTSAIANSLAGGLGSRATGITVFQNFFVDLYLPATLTLGDEITVPVVVYNYLAEPQTVDIEVTPAAWFSLLSPARQALTLEPNAVSSVPLRIRAEQVGWHDLEAIGRAGDVGDGLRRRIEVMPSGKAVDVSQSDVLEGSVEGTHVTFEFGVPAGAVPGASELLVKLYPGVFAQAIEGLDSILKMPYGCFEQTSSSTYPNVMVLKYLQDTDATTPEIEMKAREYINLGYQRLLTYEVTGGGFEWFGNPPAHKILTAYGLMEFSDMSLVHPVDPAVITRTAAWLASRQESDGSWTPDSGGIAEGAINNYQNNKYRTTAYVLWALLESGYEGPAVGRAVSFLHARESDAADSYSKVIAAQALITADRADSVGLGFLDDLADSAVEDGDAVYWGAEAGSTGLTHSMGGSHVLETTALVIDAFFRAGVHLDLAQAGLTFLVRNKDRFGNWETTQATVYALRAMIRSMASAGSEVDGAVHVYHNGELVHSLTVTPEDYDVFRQIDLKERIVEGGANVVELVMTGTGKLMYQAVGTFWTPWDDVPADPPGPLSIDVAYDRTHLEVDDTATATVTVTNHTAGDLMMVLVDLGIPPGFEVQTEDLDALRGAGVFRRWEMTGRQIILYFDQIEPGPPVVFTYRLIARNPMRGEAPPATAYLYYEPDVRDLSRPIQIRVD